MLHVQINTGIIKMIATCDMFYYTCACVGNHRYVYMYMYMNSERIMGTCTCTPMHILYMCIYLGPSFSMHCMVLWTKTFSVGCLYVRVHTVVFRASIHGPLNITQDFSPHGRLPRIKFV